MKAVFSEFSQRAPRFASRLSRLALLALLCSSVRAGVGVAATASPDAPHHSPTFSTMEAPAREITPADREASADALGLLFDSGTPLTNPYSVCGGCYAWSSTYYQSADNFDLTARKFTVPAGSFASAIRVWFAYGDDGPHPNSANLGGAPSDFSAISFDLYAADGPGGSPGAWLANLTGSWTILDAPTNYRELLLDEPYVFGGADYYLSLRAETALGDYQATLLWAMCAPSDPHIDYASYDNANGDTDGWVDYPSQAPCPADQNFGLQIVGAMTPDEIEIVAEDGCITPSDPCKTLAFDLNRADTTPMRGFSVTFQLSGLDLCEGVGSIAEGPYLADHCGGGCTAMQVIDHGSGLYTVDAAILGAGCGPTGSGTLFTVDVESSGVDGAGTITVTNVLARDCFNAPIPAAPGSGAVLTIDSFGPAPVADLAVAPVLAGNLPDGTIGVTLSFSTPGDADVVEVYRAPFGNHPGTPNAYPEYDDVAGAGPPPPPTYPPAAPWSLTGVTTSGGIDDPGVRGYWYYAMFTKDACGNVSAVSNVAGGVLDYHLGDVSDGSNPGAGDNEVGLADLSLLGAHYGITLVPDDPFHYLDVGPTSDGSVLGLPMTDDRVDFDDLILFAINFGQVSVAPPGGWTAPFSTAAAPALETRLAQPRIEIESDWSNGRAVAVLRLVGNGGQVQGLHVRVGGESDVRLLSDSVGPLLESQTAPSFVKVYESEGNVVFDAALLGRGAAIEGNGVLARLVLESSTAPRLEQVCLRDVANRELGPERPRVHLAADASGGAGLREDAFGGSGELSPTEDSSKGTASGEEAMAQEEGANDAFAAVSISPNPFLEGTRIVYRTPSETHLEAAIFDVSGQRVFGWPSLRLDAGSHELHWDGRSDSGAEAPAGVYLLRLESRDGPIVRKLFRVRS